MKRKPRRGRPVLAWAVVDRKGRIILDTYGDPLIHKKKQSADILESDERIARVRITEL